MLTRIHSFFILLSIGFILLTLNNKLYSLFQVEDIYLTSTTELMDDRLIFEVTSGKAINETKAKSFADECFMVPESRDFLRPMSCAFPRNEPRH